MITPAPYSGTLLTIEGVAIPELISYSVTEAKLWRDSDRNMNGELRATLIGVFPKIELNIGHTNRTRAKEIAEVLDRSYFGVTYFDPSLNTTRTASFYAGDYSIEFESKQRGIMKPVKVNLIPVARR